MKGHLNQLEYHKGLSLIELLIALALSSILSLALFEVFKIARDASSRVTGANEMLDSAQLSFSVLQDSINMAGFWGGVDSRELTLISKQLSAFPGNCNSAWVLNIEQGLQGFDGRENANDIPALPSDCLSKDYVPHSDVLLVRRASVNDPVPEEKLGNKYYKKRFIVRGSPETGGIVFQGKDMAKARQQVPPSAFVVNSLLSIDMYYLEYCKDEELCDVSGIGLSRYTLIGNRFIKQRLVNGVAQMQFEYGLDLSGDGKVERYLTADNVFSWNDVLSVRVFALFKSKLSASSNENPEREFKLGTGFEFEPEEHERRYKFKKFQSEFSLKNT
ncbi:hypothetical protein A3740_05840 [Oleiphilus sp. HI0068]|jgi:prepilin-type N-terminal cleavage/methylation domain-containing protein|uniref:PilW family protein n=4 Tax=unclassified Oleiphilus TaxID=2631174 RepID=UPI0007C25F5D|nr:PilW family protein [Oleiphilus sp. HI0132]KZY79863.1 hypothetical protein A3741_00815 [Oleiphilus sp. HI0069]KZY82099.1 hypothetical protein A3740_05840 [Oleiphilus sp. HI0068]KZZ33273.1 hypothetical protein A3755_08135 [Oleiphilus sp. HI0085]KZZ75543.1 hypothetical protein A3766_03210 [Oleiphilus sp. HI0132]